MADFFLTTSSNVAQTLAFADSGVVATGVTLFTGGATSAVTMTDSARLTVLGSVVTENANTLAMGPAVPIATVNVGQAGSMISMLNAAISGTVNDQFYLNNAGLIQGFAEAIRLNATTVVGVTADYHLVNSGTIQSNGDAQNETTIEITFASFGTVTFANSGTILNGGTGGAIRISGADVDLSNSGTIQTAEHIAIETDTGFDQISNSGLIRGNISLGSGGDTVVNRGDIIGSVDLGDDADLFVSKGGTVSGFVVGGGGNDVYRIDDGTIAIDDSSGFDQIISSDDVGMASGIETLTLTGAKGLRGQGNELDNTIAGGAGDDTILGASGDDFLTDSRGNNVISGGFGEDSLIASGESQMLRGGAGNDLIRLSDGDATIQGGSGQDFLVLLANDRVEANLTTGKVKVGLDAVLSVDGIEDLQGGFGNDLLIGSAAANRLTDFVGSDEMRGQGGDDVLTGGDGSDTLSGGTGADTFVYESVSDSALGGSIDTITDFSVAQDHIDLSAINIAPSDSGPFTFIGSGAFTGSKAEVRFFTDAVLGQTVIEVRLENSVADDMQIILTGIKALTADNFVL